VTYFSHRGDRYFDRELRCRTRPRSVWRARTSHRAIYELCTCVGRCDAASGASRGGSRRPLPGQVTAADNKKHP
jgi:hypothetical protein